MNRNYAPDIVPTAAEIIASPSASYWLKGAIAALQQRDPLDAARDAAMLSEIMAAECDKVLAETE